MGDRHHQRRHRGLIVRTPARGEIWDADLNPTRGHEQGGFRPCIVVSCESYNAMPINMVIVVPLTSRGRGLDHQTPIGASKTSGLDHTSYARPEDVRAVSSDRLRRRRGHIVLSEMQDIERVLGFFLGLPVGQ